MKRKIIITIIIAVAIAALGVLGVQFVRLSQENEKQQEDLKAAEELLDMEKRQAQEDLLSMQAEINEFSAMNIGNDSLIAQIEEQKQKIQLLIDELNTVKATDAKKIQELKDELSVVRTVLYDYIRKVDSLNRVNSALRNENSQMKQQVEETTTKNEQLTKDKQQLTEVVTRAAMIDVDILSVETLNKRGNVTNRLGKIQRIAVNILIGKNVTTQVGYKTIYMRILSPSARVPEQGQHQVQVRRQLHSLLNEEGHRVQGREAAADTVLRRDRDPHARHVQSRCLHRRRGARFHHIQHHKEVNSSRPHRNEKG